MTQPAVSQAIMQLERELDIRLFNRTPKGVSLTNEGSLLFEYVNSAINLINVGEENILEFKGLTVGELKIGVQHSKKEDHCIIASWVIDGEKVETVAEFIFLGSKITVNSDCSHEI